MCGLEKAFCIIQGAMDYVWYFTGSNRRFEPVQT